MTWILTQSGQQFDLLRPTASMIKPVDIAHALSRLCRFNGHTRAHYSVAQHSLIVASLVPVEHQLVALLHDAPEAYIGDMTRPLKAEAELAALREETSTQPPDAVLCDFYEVTDYPGLVRELIGHVSQLQESAKRNVKPWEDTFPPTLLPAYIERVNAANAAALPQDKPVAGDWLLVTHSSGAEWTVKRGSKEHDRALRANHLTITPLLPQAKQPALVSEG